MLLLNDYRCLPGGLVAVMSDFYDPMDYSPPGSSVHRILQARILGWVHHLLLQLLTWSATIVFLFSESRYISPSLLFHSKNPCPCE